MFNVKRTICPLLVLATLASADAAQAATYYVGKTGNDGYSCPQATNEATPKLTITAGLACLATSDTLLIKAGTYTESIPRLAVPSGAAGAPTTVSGFGTDVVTLRPPADVVAGIWVIGGGRSYITIKKMVIDGVNVPPSSPASAILVYEAASYITFENLEITHGAASGIMFTGTNSDLVNHVTMRNITAHHNGTTNLNHGFYLHGTDHVIENSESYSNSGFGIHVYGGGNNHRTLVRNNRIHDNGATGILVGTGNNHVVYNNLVWNNGYTSGGRGILIYAGTPNNNQIYNNTVYKNNGVCIDVSSASINVIVKNNICWQNAANSVADAGTGSSISNNLDTDPKFYNASSADFRLLQGSQAIDKGATVSIVGYDFLWLKRPQGYSHDIGAYESTSGADSVPPSPPVNVSIR